MNDLFFKLSGIITFITIIVSFIFFLIAIWLNDKLVPDVISRILGVLLIILFISPILYWLCVGFACWFDEILKLGLRY